MAGRIERCSGCRRQLQVSPYAVAVQCSVCQTVTNVRPLERRNQPFYPPFRQPPVRRFQSLEPWDQPFHPPVRAPPARRMPLDDRRNPAFHSEAHVQRRARPPVVRILPPASSSTSSTSSSLSSDSDLDSEIEEPPPRPAMGIPAQLTPPSGHRGRKRAVLCGVSYNNSSHRLSGSVNDVNRMRSLLVGKLGFPTDCVLMLTEEEKKPRYIPTKKNIRSALRWLVQDCKRGDSLVFHFSGHGSRQKDFNNDERDGFDETLAPVDHETEGQIIDDEINATIVRPLPRGARLHAIVDSCYSGTVLDLPFLCRLTRQGYYRWEDQRGPNAGNKGTSGGLAICISACDDHQTSASTATFSSEELTGAMTSSFIQAVQNEPGLTYGRLLSVMQQVIPTLIKNNTHLFQEPLLSTSEKFDIHEKKLIL